MVRGLRSFVGVMSRSPWFVNWDLNTNLDTLILELVKYVISGS